MNDSTHAPSLLLTWRDVLDRIRASSHQTPWSSCEADPFGLRVYCDDEGATRSALEVILGAAFDPIEDKVSLVSSEALVRALPVLILPAAERPPERVHVQRPLWSAGALKVQPASKSPSTALAAFFSFKGGVGRTTSAFATLIALLDRERPKRVLYIDADVEAPGLTWMMGPEERLSWVDALALIHESDDWQRDVLPLIAERAQRPAVDLELPAGRRSFYFMPAVRHIEQVEQIPVTPEQVVRRRDRAWVIGDLLAALGERLGLDAILIDLRAGITEFSSPLLLDPRVRNVLVTSCAEQAIKGTERALHLVEARTS